MKKNNKYLLRYFGWDELKSVTITMKKAKEPLKKVRMRVKSTILQLITDLLQKRLET